MRLFYCLVFMAFASASYAQTTGTDAIPKKKRSKGEFYVSWGYNRDWFANSDIHFENLSNKYNPQTGLTDYYSFTIYDVKASDRPDQDRLLRTQLTIPQYNYRIGYYFNDKYDLGIEINFDHAKYIVDDYQTVRIKGQFNGVPVDRDTVLDPKKFLHFEHSDGANYLMLNIMKRFKFWESKNKWFGVSAVAKLGGGVVIPRTDVTLFGEELNNCFHIAGWIAGAEGGLRLKFLKYGFTEFTGKGVIANYANVLVIGDGKANHYLKGSELIWTAGLQFPL